MKFTVTTNNSGLVLKAMEYPEKFQIIDIKSNGYVYTAIQMADLNTYGGCADFGFLLSLCKGFSVSLVMRRPGWLDETVTNLRTGEPVEVQADIVA